MKVCTSVSRRKMSKTNNALVVWTRYKMEYWLAPLLNLTSFFFLPLRRRTKLIHSFPVRIVDRLLEDSEEQVKWKSELRIWFKLIPTMMLLVQRGSVQKQSCSLSSRISRYSLIDDFQIYFTRCLSDGRSTQIHLQFLRSRGLLFYEILTSISFFHSLEDVISKNCGTSSLMIKMISLVFGKALPIPMLPKRSIWGPIVTHNCEELTVNVFNPTIERFVIWFGRQVWNRYHLQQCLLF